MVKGSKGCVAVASPWWWRDDQIKEKYLKVLWSHWQVSVSNNFQGHQRGLFRFSLGSSIKNILILTLTPPWRGVQRPADGNKKETLPPAQRRWRGHRTSNGALSAGHLKWQGMGWLDLHSIWNNTTKINQEKLTTWTSSKYKKGLNSTSHNSNGSITEESHCVVQS